MTLPWLAEAGFPELDAFLTSAAIGLLMGAERERRPTARAGVRTFALIALFGAATAMIGEHTAAPWLVAVGLVIVGAMMISAYAGDPPDDDPGTTTIVAAVLCYALAVLVWHGHAQLALMTGIGATALLYFKSELRGITLRLDRVELVSILQFAVLSFVVLPMLPDRGFGPFEAVNPRQVWLMVVLISGVSLAGYVALRFVGARHGALLLGVFGGLVSSTATTLAYSRHARALPEAMRLSATVIVVANLVVLVRIALVVAVVAPGVASAVLPVLAGGLLPGFAVGAWLWQRDSGQDTPPVPLVGNPAAVRASLGFGALYGAVLLAAAWLRDAVGTAGLYAVAVVSGLTDVDAITLSALRLNDLGQLPAAGVTTVILIALTANMAFKLAAAGITGGAALAKRCAWPMAATLAGAIVVALLR